MNEIIWDTNIIWLVIAIICAAGAVVAIAWFKQIR